MGFLKKRSNNTVEVNSLAISMVLELPEKINFWSKNLVEDSHYHSGVEFYNLHILLYSATCD